VGGAVLGIITSAIVWYVGKPDLCERLLETYSVFWHNVRVAAKMEDAA
jgi:hypothetical protein